MARLALTQARNVAATRTVPTYPHTPLGGVYIPGAKSIEGATGDIARTTVGWIENEKYHWYANQVATAWSAEFDTAVTRTGTKTLKVSTTDTTGRPYINQDPAGLLKNVLSHAARIKPSTQYVFSCYAKTTNVASGSVYIRCSQRNASNGQLTIVDTNALTGTNDWTLLTATFTSDATAVFCPFQLQNITAGNVSDAWFDVSGMTLIQTGVSRNAVV